VATVRELLARYRAKAESIREELRFRRCATGEELEAYWPGGSENPGKDIDAWIYCYASMVRFCDRLDAADERKAAAESGSENEVIRALADTPEPVVLSSGKTVTIHPKSLIALEFIERLDHRIQWLTEKRADLLKRNGYDDVKLIDDAVAEINLLYGVIAWAALHEGCGLPFSEIEVLTTLPEEVRSLSPTDFPMVHNAFLKVNAIRLHVLLMMYSEKQAPEPGARQSWATFFAMREEQSHTPAKTLMRERSLASQVAASLLAADVHLEAREKAERESQEREAVA
jgi:hypothetical protein